MAYNRNPYEGEETLRKPLSEWYALAEKRYKWKKEHPGEDYDEAHKGKKAGSQQER